MATHPLTTQFAEAQRNVNLGSRRLVAMAAHTEVRSILRAAVPLVDLGLDDVLIGSYARETGIWPGKQRIGSLRNRSSCSEASLVGVSTTIRTSKSPFASLVRRLSGRAGIP